MSSFHTLLGGAAVTFFAIAVKLWWDLRDSELKLDKKFRDDLTEYREEYWSRFVVTPLSKFFEKASGLIENKPQDYSCLQDVLDHQRHGSILESYVVVASEQYEKYRRLSHLTTNIRKAQESQRSWIIRTVGFLLGLFLTVLADLFNEAAVGWNFFIDATMITLILTVVFIGWCVGTIFTFYRFYEAQNEYHNLQSFYSDCKDKIHGASSEND